MFRRILFRPYIIIKVQLCLVLSSFTPEILLCHDFKGEVPPLFIALVVYIVVVEKLGDRRVRHFGLKVPADVTLEML